MAAVVSLRSRIPCWASGNKWSRQGNVRVSTMTSIDDASEAYFAERSTQALGAFRVSEIARPLEEIPIAIFNRIQREFRAQLGELLFLLLELMVRVSGDTWSTVRFLVGNKLDHGRRVEFIYAIPPLTRTILDSLMTVIFLFEGEATEADQARHEGLDPIFAEPGEVPSQGQGCDAGRIPPPPRRLVLQGSVPGVPPGFQWPRAPWWDLCSTG